MDDLDDDERVPWVSTLICAGLYAAPTMLTLSPALIDERIVELTGWPAASLTAASSLMFAAAAPGAVAGSSAADKRGRLPLTLLMTVGTGLCLLLMVLAPSNAFGAVLFCASRVAGGFAQGGVAPTTWTWLMELTPGPQKGASMSLKLECLAIDGIRKSIHPTRTSGEMITRPKMSRNEWKLAEI